MAPQHQRRQWLPCSAGCLPLLLLLAIPGAVSPVAGQSITDYPVRFYVIGDWGRASASNLSGYNQTRVADRMARVATGRGTSRPRFVISTGDNFYSYGLTGANDPNFRTKFTSVYNQSILKIPWHSVLGNHDYGHTSDCKPGRVTTPLAQLDPAIRQVDSRFFAYRNGVLELAGGKVLIAFWDTNPSQEDYNYGCFAGFQGGLSTQDWVNNQVWLRDTLNRSTADWKLIVGHHPPHSSGRYAPGVLEVQVAVQRLIKRSGAQVYFAGHEHNLEYLHYKRSSAYQPNYHIVISGGSSLRSTTGFGSPAANPTSRFSKWGRKTDGFALVKVTLQELRVEFFHLDYRDGLAPAYTAYIPRVPGGGPG